VRDGASLACGRLIPLRSLQFIFGTVISTFLADALAAPPA
jgi:hypothetical protein